MVEDISKYSAPALEKGLDILELLSMATEPLSMGQVAEQLSRCKGEIFRMLIALVRIPRKSVFFGSKSMS